MTNKIDYEQITIDTLNEYIREVKKKEFVATIDSHLINDLDIDSLDTIELAFLVEEKFGVKISIDTMMGLQLATVRDIVSFFKEEQNDQKVQ
jgi:acyl carrier protein